MPKLSLIRNACPSLQPSGGKCTFSLRSGPSGRNGISGSHLSHGHPRTARHGPRRKGDARFLYYLFSVFYVNPFKERRPRGHTARLRAKADAKVAQKRRTAKKTGTFLGRKGKVFAKTDKTEGGRETGRLAIWAPHGTGRRHGTGAGARRGGRIQRETLKNAKKDYTAQGAMPGGKGEETGRHRKRGPPETQKGRTRKAGRAGWKTSKGTPEPPESPDGRGKGRKRKRGGRTRASPPHCKGKGKKGGMQTGKEKTGQRKREGKTSRESGAEARTKGSGRRKRKSLPNIPKGHVAGREEKRDFLYTNHS